MRSSAVAVVALVSLAACTPPGSGGGGSVGSSQSAAIDAVFKRFTAPGSPGCALGLYQNGAVTYSKGYGLADLERDVPITPSTIFDLGSTSKQFAAASIILLAEDGKLALTDDVRKYVPELPDYGTPITIDHLLRHTSGLRDYAGLLSMAGHDLVDVTNDADALEVISRQKALNFAPGSRWDYSNTGFFLLSTIVERVSGKNLRDFAKERIFGPLGMTKTHFRNDHNELLHGRALAYSPGDSGVYRSDMSNWEQLGDGAVQSNVEELLAWDKNFVDHKVGGAELIAKLEEPGKLNDGKEHGYARGLFHDAYRGLKRVHHGGAWGGYRAMLMRFPEQKTSIAILCNVADAGTMQLAEGVADAVLGDALSKAEPGAKTAGVDSGAKPASAGNLERLVGMYYNDQERQVIRIAKEGDSAFALLGQGRYPLAPAGAGSYLVAGFLKLDFAAGDGPADSFHSTAGGSDQGTYNRVTPATPDIAALNALAGKYYSPELSTTWTISVENGKLVSTGRAVGRSVLEPAMTDVFTGDGLIRFERAGGRVIGFSLDAGRMLGIRFERRS